LVHDGRTGLLFEPGNPADLALKIHALLDDPARTIGMRRAARREYEDKYTAETNYRMMIAIFEEAAESSRLKVHGSRFSGSRFNG